MRTNNCSYTVFLYIKNIQKSTVAAAIAAIAAIAVTTVFVTIAVTAVVSLQSNEQYQDTSLLCTRARISQELLILHNSHNLHIQLIESTSKYGTFYNSFYCPLSFQIY